MKTPASISCLLAVVLGSSTLRGGVSIRRAGDFTTAVPITSVTAADLDLPVADILDVLRQTAIRPPPAADLALLRGQMPFRSLPNDQAVVDRFQTIPVAAIDAIEVIRRSDDDAAGTALAYVLNNRRISLAFGGMPGDVDMIRDDGSASYGSEAINLHWVPQPLPGEGRIRLYDPDGFHLTHSLAGMGRYMLTPGYELQPPRSDPEWADWALSNQLRSISVGTAAVERLKGAVTVLNGIAATLELPDGSSGIARNIGRELLNDPVLTDAQKRQKARDLLAFIEGELLPGEEWGLNARVFYRETLDLRRAGKLNGYATYNDPFKQPAYFSGTLRKPGTDFPYTSYFGGGGSVVNPGTAPVIDVDNRFWRVSGKSDGTRDAETFQLDELAGISMGGFDGRRLFVGGPSMDLSRFICYGYLDMDGDGRIESGTKRELFTSPHLMNGAHLAWNPVTGNGIILDRRNGNLFEMDPPSVDLFPTGLVPRGSLGTERTDAWRLGISFDGKWALGYPEFGGTLAPYYQHTESYFDGSNGGYQPLRIGYSFEEVKINAALAGPLVESAPDATFRFSGTPDTDYRAYVKEDSGWAAKANATTDPLGRGYFYIPGTDTAVKIGGHVRIATESGDDVSPEYTVTRDPALPRILAPSVSRKGDVQLPFVSPAYSQVNLLRGTDLERFEEVDAGTASPFGTGLFKDSLPDPTGLFYAWRLQVALAAAAGVPDYFYLPVGVTRTLYPGWNDRFSPGATFAMDPVTGPAAALMVFAQISPFTSAVLGTVGTFDDTRLTYRLFQNAVFVAAYQAVIIPDLLRLANPPVLLGPNLTPIVPVRCLVIGGKNYPMLQFRFGLPEDNNPPDTNGCEDAHWHGPRDGRVYHVDNDTVGLADPRPKNCGFGPYLSIPQAEVPIPFPQWLGYRAWVVFGTLPPAASFSPSGDAVHGPASVAMRVNPDR